MLQNKTQGLIPQAHQCICKGIHGGSLSTAAPLKGASAKFVQVRHTGVCASLERMHSNTIVCLQPWNACNLPNFSTAPLHLCWSSTGGVGCGPVFIHQCEEFRFHAVPLGLQIPWLWETWQSVAVHVAQISQPPAMHTTLMTSMATPLQLGTKFIRLLEVFRF